MSKRDRINEIDMRILELETNTDIWNKNDPESKKRALLVGHEIIMLSLEKDDLLYNTHNLDIVFYEQYLYALKEKDPTNSKIPELEEKILELKFEDYINTNGFKKKLSN